MAHELTRRGRPAWMTPGYREPFGDVWFDRLFPEWPAMWGRTEREYLPTFDFYDKDGEYHLTAELPGVNKDDINVTINDGTVTITGKKEDTTEEEGKDYYLKETRGGSFSRQFRLPTDVERDKVEARYENGILELVMPHKEKGGKPGRIEIK